MRYWFLALVITLAVIGCAGGGSVTPMEPAENAAASDMTGNHQSWGLWQFSIDPESKDLDVVQLRSGDLHLNAMHFLEPPVKVYLTVEWFQFNGDNIEVDIGLRHPLLGLNQFTGFDVCGIFIVGGSVSGFTDPALVMPGEGNTRLLNPDGYSRWWNSAEFPINPGTIHGYQDGLLGTPDEFADYDSTLNAYKYYCDDLDDITDTLDDVTLENRGMFSAGMKNVRRYLIKMEGGFIFNYAVDANWKFPTGTAPWSVPEDFGPQANRVEAWRASVAETNNTLWNDGVGNGGNLSLTIDVYDWFDVEMNTVRVESPGNFGMVQTSAPGGGGEGYSTYYVDITGATPSEESIDILISVISEDENFAGFIPGTNTTAYFSHAAFVDDEEPTVTGYHWEYDDIALYTGYHSSNPVVGDFEDISPALIEESDGDIALTWAATDTYDIYVGWDSVFWLMRSTDNGATYGDLLYGDIASDNLPRDDRNKIAAGAEADAYAISGFGPAPNNTGTYISRVEDGHPNWAVGVSYNAQNIDIYIDPDGWIYNFDDSGGNVKLKHSKTPKNLWHLDSYSWSGYTTYPVASNAYVSHSRSVGRDSNNVAWIAVYNTAESQIRLSRSTDAYPHETWDDNTIVYAAGTNINQVKNPSLWIDGNDTFHICYTRFGMLTGMTELVYTKDDSSFDDPTEQVIFGAPGEIDAYISVGEKFGKQVVIFIYEWDGSIHLYTLVDGVAIGPPEEIDGNIDDIDPDAILDADECDLHAIWSTMDGDNYDLARRNAVLVED